MAPSEKASRQIYASNYFMYQWAAPDTPYPLTPHVQAAPASELILYTGPHLLPG